MWGRDNAYGFTTAIRMMAADGDLGLVVEKRIQHMKCLACGRRDHLGEERPVTVRQVRVRLEASLLTVVGVEMTGVTAGTAGLEELTIG